MNKFSDILAAPVPRKQNEYPQASLRNDNGRMNCKQTCIAEVRSAVRDAKPSATELAQLCFKEIEAQNSSINAYLALSPERAFGAAAAIDQLAAKGSPLPPLAGVPIGVIDVL